MNGFSIFREEIPVLTWPSFYCCYVKLWLSAAADVCFEQVFVELPEVLPWLIVTVVVCCYTCSFSSVVSSGQWASYAPPPSFEAIEILPSRSWVEGMQSSTNSTDMICYSAISHSLGSSEMQKDFGTRPPGWCTTLFIFMELLLSALRLLEC